MNVKQIVTEYLRRHKCDGLHYGPQGDCSCTIAQFMQHEFYCCDFNDCIPAVKRRRMVNGRRQTVLVPVE